MFKYRVISFPLLLALLAVIVWWDKGAYLFTCLAPLIIGVAVYEAGRLLERSGIANFSKTAGIFAAVTFLCTQFAVVHYNDGYLLVSVTFLCFLLLVMGLLFSILVVKDRKDQLVKGAGTLALLAFIALPLTLAGSIYFMTDAKVFLFFVLITKAMDTGGYVVGMLTAKLPGGNHKIVPSISPKKSWEGFFGGLVLTVAAALLLNDYCDINWERLPLIVLAVLFALGSFAGDLTESAIKRSADAKDSNAIIPGMGGLFDVVDSFLYNGILFCIIMILE